MMLTHFVLAFTLASPQSADTTLSGRGVRHLDIEFHKGSVEVRGWDQDQIQIGAERLEMLDIDHHGSRVSIEASRRRMDQERNVTVMVPRRLDVSIEGIKMDVTVADIEGEVTAETLQGDLDIRRVRGAIDIETISGTAQVFEAGGDVRVESTSGSIRLQNIAGEILAAVVSGNIDISGASGSFLEAETVSGTIRFEAELDPRGDYSLSSHSGRVRLEVPENVSMVVLVETHSGGLDVDIPNAVLLSSRADRKRLQFGSGGAEVDIETFSGGVQIVPRGTRRR